jgi:hypothetical protein
MEEVHASCGRPVEAGEVELVQCSVGNLLGGERKRGRI